MADERVLYAANCRMNAEYAEQQGRQDIGESLEDFASLGLVDKVGIVRDLQR